MSSVNFINVTKSYGSTQVLEDFSLQIKDGEFVSFLEISGCGKTTSLRMVSGLEENTTGEIYIGNNLVSAPEQKVMVAPEKRNVGMVFQSYAVSPHMNVFDNIAYPLKVAKKSASEIKR